VGWDGGGGGIQKPVGVLEGSRVGRGGLKSQKNPAAALHTTTHYYTLENIVEGMRKRTVGWEGGREGHELCTPFPSYLIVKRKREREKKKTGWLLLFCCCFTFPTHPPNTHHPLGRSRGAACSARWCDWFIQIGVDSVTMATPGPPKPMASPISRIRRLTFCHHHGRTRRRR